MGGIFGGQGAGTQGLPAMSGFDANAVAQALAQSGVGNNAPSGVRPGVPAGQMVNPLAQMLAGQRETYQPSDTTWGIKGDRLLRFTPQEGLGGGSGGAGAPGTLPGSVANGIQTPYGTGTIDMSKLASAMAKPTTDPTGAPAINAAMEKLKTPAATGPRPDDAMQNVITTRAAWKAIVSNPPPRSAPKADKAAWDAQRVAAEQAYIQAQKASGLSAGADPYSPFASGQVGSL